MGMVRYKGNRLGAHHRSSYARMDKPKAIAASAHKLARLVYFMLTRGKPLSKLARANMKSATANG